MWALLSRKTQVFLIVALSITLAWGIEAAAGLITKNPPSEPKLISLIVWVVSVVVVALASATWRRIWRVCPIIGRKFFPDLMGTWQGELVSTWVDPATGKPKSPIPVTIWIRQDLFSTSIKQRSGESTSYSIRSLLDATQTLAVFGSGTPTTTRHKLSIEIEAHVTKASPGLSSTSTPTPSG
jgi:hypothetical protein